MKISIPAMLKVILTASLCLSLVIQPRLAVQGADVKSASAFKTEASLYDNALRTIGSIASMKLDSPDELKKALAIFDQERANLRFHLSKRVAMALDDPTFAGAVKKMAAKKEVVEAFTNEVSADRKAIFKLDGAQAVATRIRDNSQADAALLRKVAQHLQDAAARLQKRAGVNSPIKSRHGFKMVQASFSGSPDFTETSLMPIYFEPTTILLIALVAAFCLVVPASLAIAGISRLYDNLFTDQGHAAVIACEKEADERLKSCTAQANTVPFPFNLAALAGCDAEWLLAKAACIVTSS